MKNVAEQSKYSKILTLLKKFENDTVIFLSYGEEVV